MIEGDDHDLALGEEVDPDLCHRQNLGQDLGPDIIERDPFRRPVHQNHPGHSSEGIGVEVTVIQVDPAQSLVNKFLFEVYNS